MPRYTDYDPALLFRAARYAQFPDIRRKVACERFGISPGTLRRAIQELGLACRPRLRDYVLHALTRGGTIHEGQLPDLGSLANYLDYVNKDGSQADDVQRHLEQLVDDGLLELDGTRFRLVGQFP